MSLNPTGSHSPCPLNKVWQKNTPNLQPPCGTRDRDSGGAETVRCTCCPIIPCNRCLSTYTQLCIFCDQRASTVCGGSPGSSGGAESMRCTSYDCRLCATRRSSPVTMPPAATVSGCPSRHRSWNLHLWCKLNAVRSSWQTRFRDKAEDSEPAGDHRRYAYQCMVRKQRCYMDPTSWIPDTQDLGLTAHQCVVGRPGAVDSQRCDVEPSNRTSNQQARP